MADELVLVTGGSGFVGAHCIVRLLNEGYRVRTTVRSLEREADVRAMIAEGGVESGAALSFAAADLLTDAGWPEAVADCAFVLHIASPFAPNAPEDEDELIAPAREGALRVLRAARDAGVRRVVLTSSFAAIGYGREPIGRPFSEVDWTDPDDSNVSAYVKSKTVAERAAWDFIASEGGALELATINPVGIFGPVLGSGFSSSIQIVQRMLDGGMASLPHLSTNVVDVRDVADLHLRAMADPAASGERFLAVAGPPMTLQEIATLLRARLPDEAGRVPTRTLPDWVVRFVSRFNPALKPILPELGKVKHATNEKARRVLGWTPRANDETIIATAESLARLGLVRPSPRAA
ncbi:MAG TPA: aldehyde reductase [Thermomicrobiales bacterium]|jgi:dihydroflavonol-4-reductase